jgi:hypothetical protein
VRVIQETVNSSKTCRHKTVTTKGKGNIHPRTGHEGTEGGLEVQLHSIFKPWHSISLWSVSMLHSHVCLGLSKKYFTLTFSDQNCERISNISHACYRLHQFYPPSLFHSNSILKMAQIMKYLQYFLASSNFLPHGSIFSQLLAENNFKEMTYFNDLE